MADTINSVNQKIGMMDNFWEYRSFKEQGLDILPQIHLGTKASALEKAGIHTNRGNINRQIIANNLGIQKARAAYEQAKEQLRIAASIPVTTVKAITSEIIDMIAEVAKRNNDRLKLPIVKGKFLRLISDRAGVQDKAKMEKFVQDMGWTSFAEMKAFKAEQADKFSEITSQRVGMQERMSYLESLLSAYKEYEPYIKFHKEQWAVTGWERKKYERKHISELAFYDAHRNNLKSMIQEPDKKITPKAWEKELSSLQASFDKTQKPYASLVSKLSAVEVLEYNRAELDRMIGNETHDKYRDNTRRRNKDNQSL